MDRRTLTPQAAAAVAAMDALAAVGSATVRVPVECDACRSNPAEYITGPTDATPALARCARCAGSTSGSLYTLEQVRGYRTEPVPAWGERDAIIEALNAAERCSGH